MTPRLLVVGDGGMNTGFERVVRGVLEHLHQLGAYEITHRAIGYDPDRALRTYPWTTKPLNNLPGDPLGVLSFADWVEEDRPDLVFFVQDLWNIANWLCYKPVELPVVAYFPVDCPNMKWNYAIATGALSEAVTYTQFGAREAAAGVRDAVDIVFRGPKATEEVRTVPVEWFYMPSKELDMQLPCRIDRLARYQNVDAWNVIPHGTDTGLFYPMDKAYCRTQWGFPQDAFIVLNVNTNQFRKRQDLTLRAFRYLLQENPKALLVFHCAGGDRDGWDLLQLARYYRVADRVVCVHRRYPELTDEQLRLLYNSADVQINTSGGEGWGLTSFEGAACGIPQLVPDWSATRELWRGYGHLLEISDWRHEPKYLNTAHAIVDAEMAGRALVSLMDPAVHDHLVKRALAQADRLLGWDVVGSAFHSVLTAALNEPPSHPLTYAEILAAQEGLVESELAGRVSLAA